MKCAECGTKMKSGIKNKGQIFCRPLCKWRFERLMDLAEEELKEVSKMNYMEDKLRWRYG